MNIEEIERSLPWGLHDAFLERLALDWVKRTLVIDVRVMMTQHQDMDRLARIEVADLVFCCIDPPEIDPARVREHDDQRGLWIDAGAGPASADFRERLPSVPDGCFLHWLYVRNWNRFIHVCGRDAALEWLEPEPVPSRWGVRAFFPGEEMPFSLPGSDDKNGQ